MKYLFLKNVGELPEFLENSWWGDAVIITTQTIQARRAVDFFLLYVCLFLPNTRSLK